MKLRIATMADVAPVNDLIATSARGLSVGYYSPAQVEALVAHVFGVDTQLVADGTYFVIEDDDGMPAAAGGWSARRTLYGGDQAKVDALDPRLDPASEPARIRAFFVHPAYARRGLGRQLYTACAEAARAAGFRALELMSTLPGEPLYRTLGFTAVEPAELALPGGVVVPLVRMAQRLDSPSGAVHSPPA